MVQNKEWLFSGAGLTTLGVAWWLFAKWRGSNREPQVANAATNAVIQSPSINVSPTINISSHSIPELAKPEPTPPTTPAEIARPNLRLEASKIGHPCLQEDVWTLTPTEYRPKKRYKGLLVDVANVPTASGKIKAVKVKASLLVGTRNYSPLPWLGEYTNAARLEPAARKTILLAVGDDEQMGPWYFVLNHRERHSQLVDNTSMDWTNMAPIPSHPLEILLVDVDSGELVAAFNYIWTFDSNLGFPFLKTIPEKHDS
jgi:hypothetical protein